MAERRMFSIMVINSDAFLAMPISARYLYYHLSMNARDKGILNNARTHTKCVGCNENDLQTLIDAGFIREISEGVFEIVHWYMNNGIGSNAKMRKTYGYRQWRERVVERDNVCQICGGEEDLHAHHKKSFSQYPLLRYDVTNGITLCNECHKKVHKGELSYE